MLTNRDFVLEIRKKVRTKNATIAALLRKDGTLVDIVMAGDEDNLVKVAALRKASEVVIVNFTNEPVTKELAMNLARKYPHHKIYIISQGNATNYTVAEVKIKTA